MNQPIPMYFKILPFIITLLLVLCTIPNYGQADSLKLEIENYHTPDTTRINMIYGYSRLDNLNWETSHKTLMEEAFRLSGKLGYKKGIAEGHFLLAGYHNFKSENELSIIHYQKAITNYKELGDTLNLLSAYSNFSNVYNQTQDFDRALELNLKALELAKYLPASPSKASYYFYTAKTYDRMEDYANSAKYFEGAKTISQKCGFTMGVEISNGSLGQNYTMLKEYDKALPLIKSFLDFTVLTGQKLNSAGAYKSLGECYWYMENYEDALPNLLKAVTLYEELESKVYLVDGYNRIADSYEHLNQSKNAITYYKKEASLAKELNDQSKTEAIEELKTKYETDQLKQDKTIAQTNEFNALEKERQSRLVSYLSIGVVLLIGAFLFYIISKLKVIRAQKLKLDAAYLKLEEAKKNELAMSNLKALQSQMNPHFIFNALNSVQDLVLQQETMKSYDYLVVFSKLVRNILEYSERVVILLEEELTFLESYLSLEKLRFQDDFEYTITNTASKDLQITSLIVQPFVENALKHGLLHQAGLKKLDVTFYKEKHLMCEIVDNGIGREASKKINKRQGARHDSFSTRAIAERMKILSSQYDGEAGFKITDLKNQDGAPSGTKVVITLPFQKNEG